MSSTAVVRAEVVQVEPVEDTNAPVQTAVIPGMIPKSMLDKAKPALLQFLDEELNYAEGERQGFVRKLARWKVAYHAPLQTEPKHFPIFNSSNVTVEVIKEAVNTIAAQLVQATMTARPRWVFKDLALEWEPFVDDLEQFLDIQSDRDLQLPTHVIPWILETSKLGTGIMERGYAVESTRIFKSSPDGTRMYPKKVNKRDGPAVQHIPLDKFWIRFTEKTIQSARWVAKEMKFSEMQLRQWEKDGKLHDVEEIINRGETNIVDDVTSVQEQMEDTVPSDREQYTLFEVWCTFDIDGKGPAELKLYYDKDLGRLYGEFFSPFEHGKRPFIKLGYFPVEDRFYDMGLCEMLEQNQVTISAITNRRADNATMANLKMIIKKKIVSGLKPGDPLYTGKVIETNDPFRDIREFSLSDIYPSTVMEEQIAQTRGDRLAGVSEATSGGAMPVSRTTASAQLALLQEQAKRIDLTVRSIREGLNEIGQHCLDMNFQFGVNGKAVAWMGERGKVVEAIFRIPRALLELGYGIRAQTPTSLQNRQVKRENKIALFNLLMQAHEKLLPFAQAFAPEEMPRLAQSMVASSKKYLTDVLETFEETDPEGVLAGLTVLERILPRPEDLGGLDAFQRATSSAETLEAVSRLESSLREIDSFRNGGEGVRPVGGNGERVSAPERVSRGSQSGLGFLPDDLFDKEGG